MKKRGQAQLEYVVLFILILGAVLPLLYFSGNSLGNVYRTNQVEDTVRSIAITGKSVNNLGEGNTETVVVSIPEGVNDAYVDGNSIVYVLGDKEIKETTGQEFYGILPKEAGLHNIQIEAIGGGIIKLGDMPFIISMEPSEIHIPSWKGDDIIIRGKDLDNAFEIYYAFSEEPEDLILMPKSYYTQVSPSVIYLNPQHLFGQAGNDQSFDILIKIEEGHFSNRESIHIYRKKTNDPSSE
jgi:hypothetical protein